MGKEFESKLAAISDYHKSNCMPNLSIDCVIFGFNEDVLKVLLIRFAGEHCWSLPGGYIMKYENLNDATKRILQARTGATNVYLVQFETFGDLERSESYFSKMPEDVFGNGRFITVGYYCLADFSTLDPKIDFYTDACSWHDINELPDFIMDHNQIFKAAYTRLQRDLNFLPIAYQLLPDKFTMTELQNLYEAILNRKLNRGNFYRKMMRYNILIKLEETKKGGAYKSPNYYTFNMPEYTKALEKGFQESW